MSRILHLCSYYAGSEVHKQLIAELSQHPEVEHQQVFVPIRDIKNARGNNFGSEKVEFLYVNCLNILTRLLFSLKQIRIAVAFFRNRKRFQNDTPPTLIHAHTLYADGPLAYLLHKIYSIPYVITVRGTDINLGQKAFAHWHPLTTRILRNARCVIFISPAHKTSIQSSYIRAIERSIISPNGIPQFWINSAILKKPPRETNQVKAIYIGAINKNKNIKRLIEGFLEANLPNDTQLTLIGGNLIDYERLYGPLNNEVKERIIFKGKIKDKSEIRKELLESSIFIMPSHSETFGLVYLEAISQATPIVYTLGQGIDGYFDDGEVGFGCDPNDTPSIKDAIEKALIKFPRGLDFTTQKINPASEFSWKRIASRMINEVY